MVNHAVHLLKWKLIEKCLNMLLETNLKSWILKSILRDPFPTLTLLSRTMCTTLTNNFQLIPNGAFLQFYCLLKREMLYSEHYLQILAFHITFIIWPLIAGFYLLCSPSGAVAVVDTIMLIWNEISYWMFCMRLLKIELLLFIIIVN